MSAYSSFIAQALQQAAGIALRHFGTVTAATKATDNNQVLTQADLEIGSYLVEHVRQQFPKHNIIDEEAGVIDNASEFTWVIDPIDGTSNFANGVPTYGCMIGLLWANEAIAGGIVLPAFQEVYLGELGVGATCNGKPILVTAEQRLQSCLVAYGIDGHQEDPERTRNESSVLAEIILNIRNLRTTNSAFDMVQVAAGRYGAYLNQTTKIWDNVALQPIIEAAGGVVTDFWGQPMDYSNPLQRANENMTICAASPALHRQLQHILKEAK